MRYLKNNNMRRKMTSYEAVGIAEGFVEAKDSDEVLAAWQYIYDHELYNGLQGWFGRTLKDLIDAGYIETK
tara:strand:+ start:176 stop:388 length:213 start_codon:yes stop_codon:yes gene_type:complete